MRKLIVLLVLCLLSVSIVGCAEEVALFIGGVETGITLAEQQIEELDQVVQDANEISEQLAAMSGLAEDVLEDLDPNQIALLASMLDKDPEQLEATVNDIIRSYNKANGAVATVKKKSKDPGYWVALAAALTAAYQKYKRVKTV